MERGLLLTNDIPGITASGVLKPSPDTPGASDLVVDVAQPWITGGLAVDNRGSRFSGIYTVAGDVEFNSIFGADQLGIDRDLLARFDWISRSRARCAIAARSATTA